MTLSEKLYNLRRKQGLSQEALAEKLNCLRQVISLLGCVSLIVFGAISVFSYETADKIAQSSMIVIDGTFIAMLVSVLFVVFGAIILIKTMKHK